MWGWAYAALSMRPWQNGNMIRSWTPCRDILKILFPAIVRLWLPHRLYESRLSKVLPNY
jgi:hypothetical protein